MHKLAVIAHQGFSAFSVLQSNIHSYWAWRYSSTLGSATINYAPSDCFVTFPFPIGNEVKLDSIGRKYHECRAALMEKLWLGLTDTYNLFHAQDLTPALIAKVSKKTVEEAEAFVEGVLELRRLHCQLDLAVRDAYGWTDLDLGHDFHEVDTLPEKDRVRYTISSAARKEILKRLLAENHRRAAAEATAAALLAPVKKIRARKPKVVEPIVDLFDLDTAVPMPPAVTSTLTPRDLTKLADSEWARPGTDQANEETAVLAAILKAISTPLPKRDIRLVALLAMRPRLVTSLLEPDAAVQWKRLVGSEAAALPTGVSPLQPPADHAWGNAVRGLIGRGRMIENLEAQTWAPGEGLEQIITDSWPDGRVGMVMEVLNQRGSDALVETLPETLREWVNVRAA